MYMLIKYSMWNYVHMLIKYSMWNYLQVHRIFYAELCTDKKIFYVGLCTGI